jgi:hypothetical protein
MMNEVDAPPEKTCIVDASRRVWLSRAPVAESLAGTVPLGIRSPATTTPSSGFLRFVTRSRGI